MRIGARARIALVALATSAVMLCAAALASAQEAQTPVVSVESIHVPATRGKLVTQGVRVTASCSTDCILVVKVRIPAAVAQRLGLSKPVIGTGVVDAVAGELRTVRARVRAGAMRRLEGYNGSEGLKIRITALP